jgi:hypothetical protein
MGLIASTSNRRQPPRRSGQFGAVQTSLCGPAVFN